MSGVAGLDAVFVVKRGERASGSLSAVLFSLSPPPLTLRCYVSDDKHRVDGRKVREGVKRVQELDSVVASEQEQRRAEQCV